MKFIEQANSHHPQAIKFTAETSETETSFLNNAVYKGQRFIAEYVLDVHTHFKPSETFQYKIFSMCHPSGIMQGFVKGEALKTSLNLTVPGHYLKKELTLISVFKTHILVRGYPENFIQEALLKVHSEDRKLASIPANTKRTHL